MLEVDNRVGPVGSRWPALHLFMFSRIFNMTSLHNMAFSAYVYIALKPYELALRWGGVGWAGCQRSESTHWQNRWLLDVAGPSRQILPWQLTKPGKDVISACDVGNSAVKNLEQHEQL